MNASLPASALALQSLPIRRIAPSPSNPRKRFDAAYLDELATSIGELGMIQPITVRPLPLDRLFDFHRKHPDADPEHTPQYEIVVGECRWRAATLAGLAEVQSFIRDLDDKQVMEIQVVENLQRRDVHPLEEADGYQKLIHWPGETYAGLVIDDKGSMHHLILLDGDADDAPHQEQVDWAKSIGGELPTRQEQALLYANCKAQFKADWYWSGEAYASDSGYAWCQYFDNGFQSYDDVSLKLRARAVRRFSI